MESVHLNPRRYLDLAGFILNSAMSRLEPHQSGSWVGFVLDLESGKCFVPETKISKLCKTIDSVVPSTHVHARMLASIVGQIISTSIASGPVARLCTRAPYDELNQHRFWSDRIRLSDDAYNQLMLWKSIWFTPGTARIVFSDASESGYGGCHEAEIGTHIAHGQISCPHLFLHGESLGQLTSSLTNLLAIELQTIRMLYVLLRQGTESSSYSVHLEYF